MRPLPRYVLAIMAAFVAFELWIPLLALVLRALVGPTVPIAVQAIVPLLGLAVPAVVGLALNDYLADRQGLVRPYQPKRRPTDLDREGEEAEEELEEQDGEADEWAWGRRSGEGLEGPEPQGSGAGGQEREKTGEGQDPEPGDVADDGGWGEERDTGTTRKPLSPGNQ